MAEFSPIAYDNKHNRVYQLVRNDIYGFSIDPPEKLWSTEIESDSVIRHRGIAYFGGDVYVATFHDILKLSADTGEILETGRIPRDLMMSDRINVFNDKLVFLPEKGGLITYSLETLEEIGRVENES